MPSGPVPVRRRLSPFGATVTVLLMCHVYVEDSFWSTAPNAGVPGESVRAEGEEIRSAQPKVADTSTASAAAEMLETFMDGPPARDSRVTSGELLRAIWSGITQ